LVCHLRSCRFFESWLYSFFQLLAYTPLAFQANDVPPTALDFWILYETSAWRLPLNSFSGCGRLRLDEVMYHHSPSNALSTPRRWCCATTQPYYETIVSFPHCSKGTRISTLPDAAYERSARLPHHSFNFFSRSTRSSCSSRAYISAYNR
jgi:hypothetical protein